MKGPQAQPLDAFTQLHDKILPATVVLASWCPTMDLLAVAFIDGRIAVHRLNWERLWITRTESSPTALAWTPNGDALSIGCKSGAVLLVAPETGEPTTQQERVAEGEVPTKFPCPARGTAPSSAIDTGQTTLAIDTKCATMSEAVRPSSQ